MIARKETYNSIARSFRSKPSHLIYFFFFVKNWRQIKKLKKKPGQRHPAEYFHNNKLVWNMVLLSQRL